MTQARAAFLCRVELKSWLSLQNGKALAHSRQAVCQKQLGLTGKVACGDTGHELKRHDGKISTSRRWVTRWSKRRGVDRGLFKT